ncbi:MAG TPA: YjgN family protein [Steroidobacteraceae bacterium]|nr:YjgN family protein [Steroidobacteraceae bacterium]
MSSTTIEADVPFAATNNELPSSQRFQFTATGAEYFRIWIVNLLLTIVTLGIYSAWAKVRKLRYFYGSTRLAGSSFEYHGQPRQILKGRLIAAAFILPYVVLNSVKPLWAIPFIVLFVIVTPFLVVKSRRFQTRMTSWRNIRFGFTGTYGEAAKIYLGMALLIPLTAGLIAPYWLFAKHRFVIGKTTYGKTQFHFVASSASYYRAYLAAVGVVLVMMLSIMLFGGVAGLMTAAIGTGGESPYAAMVITIGLMGIGYTLVFATVHALTLNAALTGTGIEGNRLESELSITRVAWIYLSSAVLIVLTLGLYFPWAVVRFRRYQLSVLTLHMSGSLNTFVASEQQQVSATGEEMGDLLDLDFGL